MSVVTAVASLTTAQTPAPTATLLVATDPALSAGGGSPLLQAAPVPALEPAASSLPRTDVVAGASWVQEVGAWGAPLLVGAALLLALTGPTALRRLTHRPPAD